MKLMVRIKKYWGRRGGKKEWKGGIGREKQLVSRRNEKREDDFDQLR